MRGGLNIRGACAPAHGRAGRGSGRGPWVSPLETETSVGAFLRIQKATGYSECFNFGLLLAAVTCIISLVICCNSNEIT